MTEAILVAIITGGLSLLGVVASTVAASRKTDANIRTSQAVTDAKLEELTREVRGAQRLRPADARGGGTGKGD